MSDSNHDRLKRIEEKQDDMLAALNKVVLEHSNRLSKLETQAGFFQLGLAFLITSVGGVLTKLFVGK